MSGATRQSSHGTVESRLSDLETKFARMDTLLEGFEELCSKLSDIKSDAKENHLNPGGNEIRLGEDSHTLKMVSVESGGLVDGNINISMVFLADGQYSVLWWLRKRNGEFRRYNGKTEEEHVKDGQEKITVTTILYDVDSLSMIMALINTKTGNAHVSFDIGALNKSGIQYFEATGNRILSFAPEIVVPGAILNKTGVSTSIKVSENVIDIINDGYDHLAESYFSGINTSKTPANTFEAFNKHPKYQNAILMSVKNGSKNEIIIHVNETFAKFGGILGIRLSQNASGYIDDYRYGVSIRVINKEIGDIMPVGTVAINDFGKILYARGPNFTFTCSSAGIPVPDLQVFRLKADGTMKEMETDFSFIDDIFHQKTVSFDTASAAEGTYICRGSSGMRTADHKFTVIEHEDIVIDEKKTGVTKSTASKTSINCKASGKPTPKIELRRNYVYGSDLLKMEDERYTYKVREKKNTVRVSLNISPPDPEIDMVICLAIQDLQPYGEVQKDKRIIVNENRFKYQNETDV